MPRDEEFRAKEKKFHKMTRDGLVERGAAFVGIDTLGIDCWGADHDPAHQALLSSRVPVVENLNNLGLLHGRRGYFVMLPLKIRAGSASPVRPVVLVDRKA